ncbi:helix-turn-helix domain-containing protein [Puniceicoccaceae bacterium K14]|nr:helix-turn-helix domain-containing protein [Puniceicoccaceae bacterium K14]
MKSFLHPNIDEVALPNILHALGDSKRLQIVRNLYKASKQLTCMEAIEGIDNLPLATRSHSFRVLRESGLIRSEKRGRECLNNLRFEEIEGKFPKVLSNIIRSIPSEA